MVNNKSMEKLIPLMNRIQDIFTKHAVKFNLPQLVVIGGQNAGKNSVLESIVGRDFLPKSTDIITRRPLILQLITNTKSDEEFAEFKHTESKKFGINEVCKEIEDETYKLTFGDKGINHEPITLKIYSPSVLNLTLVDLPGLKKVPVDIADQIREMVLEYITKENALILAVTPGNIDLAECEALKLARKVDPTGTRTIGVITKLDIMGEGNDARVVLENKLYPLSRGYVGVINRNQSDIDKKKSIVDTIESETNFFKPLETACLQQILNEQLTNHIRDTLPALQKELEAELVEIKEYLGEKDLKDETLEIRSLFKMFLVVLEKFNNEIRCNLSDKVSNTASRGSRINQLMHKLHFRHIENAIRQDKDLREEIIETIRNGRGVKNSIILPDKAFENVAEAKFRKMKEPSIKCVSLIVKELTDILLDCTKHMSAYPKLREETRRILISHVIECEKKCKQNLDNSFKAELCYFNADDKDFNDFKTAENDVSYIFNIFPGGSKANGIFLGCNTFGANVVPNNLEKPKTNIASGGSKIDDATTEAQVAEKFGAMADIYLKIATKSITDIVPKNIMCFVIKNMKNFIESDLIDKLLASNTISSLMELSNEEKNKRDEFIRQREALKEALDKIASMSSPTSNE